MDQQPENELKLLLDDPSALQSRLDLFLTSLDDQALLHLSSVDLAKEGLGIDLKALPEDDNKSELKQLMRETVSNQMMTRKGRKVETAANVEESLDVPSAPPAPIVPFLPSDDDNKHPPSSLLNSPESSLDALEAEIKQETELLQPKQQPKPDINLDQTPDIEPQNIVLTSNNNKTTKSILKAPAPKGDKSSSSSGSIKSLEHILNHGVNSKMKPKSQAELLLLSGTDSFLPTTTSSTNTIEIHPIAIKAAQASFPFVTVASALLKKPASLVYIDASKENITDPKELKYIEHINKYIDSVESNNQLLENNMLNINKSGTISSTQLEVMTNLIFQNLMYTLFFKQSLYASLLNDQDRLKLIETYSETVLSHLLANDPQQIVLKTAQKSRGQQNKLDTMKIIASIMSKQQQLPVVDTVQEEEPIIDQATTKPPEITRDMKDVTSIIIFLAMLLYNHVLLIEQTDFQRLIQQHRFDSAFVTLFQQLSTLQQLLLIKELDALKLFNHMMQEYNKLCVQNPNEFVPVRAPYDIQLQDILDVIASFKSSPISPTDNELFEDFMMTNKFIVSSPEELQANFEHFIVKYYPHLKDDASNIVSSILSKHEDKIMQVNDSLKSNDEQTSFHKHIKDIHQQYFDKLLKHVFGESDIASKIEENDIENAMRQVLIVQHPSHDVPSTQEAPDVFLQDDYYLEPINMLVFSAPGNMDHLKALQSQYNNATIKQEVNKFKEALSKQQVRSRGDIQDHLIHMRSKDLISIETANFLELFLKYFDNLDILGSKNLFTFSKLTKIEELPKFIRHDLVGAGDQEILKLQQGINGVLQLNKYQDAVWNKISALINSILSEGKSSNVAESKHQVTQVLAKLRLSTHIDWKQMEMSIKYSINHSHDPGTLSAKLQEVKYAMWLSGFCSLQVASKLVQDKMLLSAQVNALHHKIEAYTKVEVIRLLNNVEGLVFGPVYRILGANNNRSKHLINALTSNPDFPYRNNRKQRASTPQKYICKVLKQPVVDTLSYLVYQTKPFIGIPNGWSWYISLPDGGNIEYAFNKQQPVKQASGITSIPVDYRKPFFDELLLTHNNQYYYKPSMKFWESYALTFGPKRHMKSRNELLFQELYNFFVGPQKQLSLGLINQHASTVELQQLDEEHFKLESDYVKVTEHTLQSVADPHPTLIEYLTKSLSSIIQQLKRSKNLVLDESTKAKQIIEYLVHASQVNKWSFRDLLYQYCLIRLMMKVPNAEYFHYLFVAFNNNKLFEKLPHLKVYEMCPELLLIQDTNSIAEVLALINKNIHFQMMQIASMFKLITVNNYQLNITIHNLISNTDDQVFMSIYKNQFKNLCANGQQVQGDVVFYYMDQDTRELKCAGFEEINQIINNPDDVDMSSIRQKLGLAESTFKHVNRLFTLNKDSMDTILNNLSIRINEAISKYSDQEELIHDALKYKEILDTYDTRINVADLSAFESILKKIGLKLPTISFGQDQVKVFEPAPNEK